MKQISINEWLDDDKISILLSCEEIKSLKEEYDSIFGDIPHIATNSEGVSIEIKTGFPLVEAFFEDITTNNEDFLYGIDSKQDYVYRYAECILKCHILCACQIAFKFPLWQDTELPEWEQVVKEALQQINKEAIQSNDEFVFPCFFPYYSNEYLWHPRFMLQWIYDVVNEFFDIAESNMYHLSLEEQEEERARNRRELKKLEDLLLGNSKK